MESAAGVNGKGWFKIPGIRPDGDRTVAEQMLGLERALAEAAGKNVLDLGCAEAPVAHAFAQAGAASVLGIELLESHLVVARLVCKDTPQVSFICAHLNDHILAHPEPERFDIVLCLGIIHKLHDPNVPMLWAARSCRDLLCFRAPSKKGRMKNGDYLIQSKFSTITCNVPKLMRGQGFVDEGTINGVRDEAVQYWRGKR